MHHTFEVRSYLDEQRRLIAAKSPDAVREATLIDYTQSQTRVVARHDCC